jgi:hypothetical protein
MWLTMQDNTGIKWAGYIKSKGGMWSSTLGKDECLWKKLDLSTATTIEKNFEVKKMGWDHWN